MMIKKIVVASHNQGKIKEIKRLLEPFKIEVVSASELDLPDVEETGVTFEENARLKSDQLSELSGLPCLADDSGLCVEALDNRPGVYTARYAPNRDFGEGMNKLMSELDATGNANRKAHFLCVLAFAIPGQETKVFEGRVDGKIATEKHGTNGFGYDEIFIPIEGDGRTFGEFGNEEKNVISHRGRAFNKFVEFLSK